MFPIDIDVQAFKKKTDVILEDTLHYCNKNSHCKKIIPFNESQLKPMLEQLLVKISIMLELAPYQKELLGHLKQLLEKKDPALLLTELKNITSLAIQAEQSIRQNQTLEEAARIKQLQIAKAQFVFKKTKLQLQSICHGHNFTGALGCDNLIKLGANKNKEAYIATIHRALRFAIAHTICMIENGSLTPLKPNAPSPRSFG